MGAGGVCVEEDSIYGDSHASEENIFQKNLDEFNGNSEVAQEVTQEVAQEVAQRVAHDVAQEVAQAKITAEITAEITTAEITAEITTEIAAEKIPAPNITPEFARDLEEVIAYDAQ